MNFSTFSIYCVVIGICFKFVQAVESTENSIVNDDDLDINPYTVIEEGCPMVTERNNLNITKLDGNWSMPYASLNWLADIGMALFNRSVKMSQITSICPRIILNHIPNSNSSNATWIFSWKCPTLKGEFEMSCWAQNNASISKHVCWNDRENRDFYLMVGATDHTNWIVLARCSPEEPGRPSEGMSWAILSKTIALAPDISEVLFGLLEGYGFDVTEFKIALSYKSCRM